MEYLPYRFLTSNQGDIKFHDGQVDVDFTHAQKMVRRVTKQYQKGLPVGVDFLNLNIPSILKTTRLRSPSRERIPSTYH